MTGVVRRSHGVNSIDGVFCLARLFFYFGFGLQVMFRQRPCPGWTGSGYGQGVAAHPSGGRLAPVGGWVGGGVVGGFFGVVVSVCLFAGGAVGVVGAFFCVVCFLPGSSLPTDFFGRVCHRTRNAVSLSLCLFASFTPTCVPSCVASLPPFPSFLHPYLVPTFRVALPHSHHRNMQSPRWHCARIVGLCMHSHARPTIRAW